MVKSRVAFAVAGLVMSMGLIAEPAGAASYAPSAPTIISAVSKRPRSVTVLVTPPRVAPGTTFIDFNYIFKLHGKVVRKVLTTNRNPTWNTMLRYQTYTIYVQTIARDKPGVWYVGPMSKGKSVKIK